MNLATYLSSAQSIAAPHLSITHTHSPDIKPTLYTTPQTHPNITCTIIRPQNVIARKKKIDCDSHMLSFLR